LTKYRVAFIEGDGIGPEVSKAARNALEALEEGHDLKFEVRLAPAGDSCLRERGAALPAESIDTVAKSDACLKAPVGESAADVIVRLRREFDLYANIRPTKGMPGVDCLAPKVDLVIVRENTEDLYLGLEFEIPGGVVAMRLVTRRASERIAEYAFRLAERRRRKRRVLVVHKSNVLRSSDGLFSEVCREVGKKHPKILLSEMYVDTAAMNLIRSPENFDVIVTTNLYGDILSDEAAQLAGGLGLAASANIGDRFALFEPVHGSAPDIAGRGVASPVAMLLSTSMMLKWLGESRRDNACGRAAGLLTKAVGQSLRSGIKTPDLGGKRTTLEVSDFVVKWIRGGST